MILIKITLQELKITRGILKINIPQIIGHLRSVKVVYSKSRGMSHISNCYITVVLLIIKLRWVSTEFPSESLHYFWTLIIKILVKRFITCICSTSFYCQGFLFWSTWLAVILKLQYLCCYGVLITTINNRRKSVILTRVKTS